MFKKQDYQVLYKIVTGGNEFDLVRNKDNTALSQHVILADAPLAKVEENQRLISSKKIQKHGFSHQYQFRYISNPDGSMRWIFPASLKKPTFLAFYDNSTRRARLAHTIFKVIFFFGLQKLVSKKLFIYSNEAIYLDSLLGKLNHKHYSIFTGTVGENRKLVIETGNGNKTESFIKVALNSSSRQLIANEKSTLNKINQINFESFTAPGLIDDSQEEVIIQENVTESRSKSSINLQKSHLQMLQEIIEKTNIKQPLKQLPILEKSQQHMEAIGGLLAGIADNNLKQLAADLHQQLVLIREQLPQDTIVPCAMAHGDYTPWNMSIGKQLSTYDWELSMESAPLFFDWFHFIYQSRVLLMHQDFEDIKNEINQLASSSEIMKLAKEYGVSINLHHQLYLLYNGSYYLLKFLKQSPLHEQAYWLLKVWLQATTQFTPAKGRKAFMPWFFQQMEEVGYALMKYTEASISQLPTHSDLDIALNKKDLPVTKVILDKFPWITQANYEQKSFMTVVTLHFADGSRLSIDLIHQFKRKHLVYLSTEKVLATSQANHEGIKTPSPEMDFEYILQFYFLNHADIPAKYLEYFGRFDEVVEHLNSKYLLPIKHLSEITRFRKFTTNMLYGRLKQFKQNKHWRLAGNSISYWLDNIKQAAGKKGKVITFSGVDGAGKTTILQNVQQVIEKEYRQKVVLKRHRPSVLPIISSLFYGKAKAEKRVMAQLPRQGNNKNTISSLLRFAYYYFDYLLGQVYLYFRYTLWGTHILYDRYFFDFIVDSRRSNIKINPAFARQLYKLVYKPDFNFFLFASPEHILARKQELKKEDIMSLTENYQQLFQAFKQPDRYQCIENLRLENTMEKIKTTINLN